MSNASPAFEADCPNCGKTLKLPASALGKQGRCPGCKTVFEIPTAEELGATDDPLGAAPANPGAGGFPAAPAASPFSGGPTSSEYDLGAAGVFGAAPGGIQNDPWNFGPQPGAPGGAPGWPGAPAGSPFGGGPAGAPFGAPGAPGGPSSVANDYMARAAAANAEAQARAAENSSSGGGFFAPEMKGMSHGVLGGIIMMVIAVVWFVAGLAADRIFFYPPILFIFGVVAVVKGLIEGNFAGRR